MKFKSHTHTGTNLPTLFLYVIDKLRGFIEILRTIHTLAFSEDYVLLKCWITIPTTTKFKFWIVIWCAFFVLKYSFSYSSSGSVSMYKHCSFQFINSFLSNLAKLKPLKVSTYKLLIYTTHSWLIISKWYRSKTYRII